MQKKFVWVKFIDPLNSNIDEVEFDKSKYTGDELDFYSNGNIGAEDLPDPSKFYTPKSSRIVQTPQGFVTLTEHSFASSHFDFWTLNCNFDITEPVVNAIKRANGVETINPITRLRCRIGFSRPLLEAGIYDITELKQGVEEAILIHDIHLLELLELENLIMFSEDVMKLASEQKNRLASDSEYWVMYILPNGKIATYSEHDRTEKLEKKQELFYTAQQLIGGQVFTSSEV